MQAGPLGFSEPCSECGQARPSKLVRYAMLLYNLKHFLRTDTNVPATSSHCVNTELLYIVQHRTIYSITLIKFHHPSLYKHDGRRQEIFGGLAGHVVLHNICYPLGGSLSPCCLFYLCDQLGNGTLTLNDRCGMFDSPSSSIRA
jgi:hypothetical protein